MGLLKSTSFSMRRCYDARANQVSEPLGNILLLATYHRRSRWLTQLITEHVMKQVTQLRKLLQNFRVLLAVGLEFCDVDLAVVILVRVLEDLLCQNLQILPFVTTHPSWATLLQRSTLLYLLSLILLCSSGLLGAFAVGLQVVQQRSHRSSCSV